MNHKHLSTLVLVLSKKATRQTFVDYESANCYAENSVFYREEIVRIGLKVPPILDYKILDDLRVEQTSKLIPGSNLHSSPSPAATALATHTLYDLPRDKNGNFAVTPDADIANFIYTPDSNALWFVDNLPPLIDKEGSFPYDRLKHAESLAGRHWHNKILAESERCGHENGSNGYVLSKSI